MIEEEPGDLTLQQSATKKDEGQIHALLGVLNISGLNYLTVVSEVETVGKLYGVTVYKIKQVKLLPFQVSRPNFAVASGIVSEPTILGRSKEVLRAGLLLLLWLRLDVFERKKNQGESTVEEGGTRSGPFE